jgi:hypothetical protein
MRRGNDRWRAKYGLVTRSRKNEDKKNIIPKNVTAFPQKLFIATDSEEPPIRMRAVGTWDEERHKGDLLRPALDPEEYAKTANKQFLVTTVLGNFGIRSSF